MQEAPCAGQQFLPLCSVEHTQELVPDAALCRMQKRFEFLIEIRLVLTIGKHSPTDQHPRAGQCAGFQRGMHILLGTDATHHQGEIALGLIRRPGRKRNAIFHYRNLAHFGRTRAALRCARRNTVALSTAAA